MPELSAELLSEAVAKGLENVERGVTDFSDWSRLMVYQFGEQIRPHLESVWERIKSERGERLTALPPPSSILPSTSNYQHPPTLPTASAAPIKRKGNYFVRHWRGDLSLGVSYWLNGLLAYLLVAILAGFVVGLKETAGLKATAAAVILLYTFAIALSVWQIVGIWRSSSNHVRRGGLAVWATLAKVAVVLGILNLASTVASDNRAAKYCICKHTTWGYRPARARARSARTSDRREPVVSRARGHQLN